MHMYMYSVVLIVNCCTSCSQTYQHNTSKFFVEDRTYWCPASTTSDLYAQLAAKKYREIARQQIT